MQKRNISSSNHVWAHLGLLLTAIIWGSSMTITQSAANAYPPIWILAIRSTIASLVLGVIFFPRLKKAQAKTFKVSTVLGLLLFIGTSFQTLAVHYSTPGRITFLSASYCVLIPFIAWIWLKEKPKAKNMWAALFCLIGVYFVSQTSDSSGAVSFTPEEFIIGDLFSLASAITYASHIVAVSKFTQEHDTIQLTVFPFFSSALFSWVATLLFEDHSGIVITTGGILQIVYLAIFCSALALLLQTTAQKHANPTLVGLILSLESIFGVMIPTALGIESLSTMILIGFFFIFTGILIAETSPAILSSIPILRHMSIASSSPTGNESE